MLKIALCIAQKELQEKYTRYITEFNSELNIDASIENYENGVQLLFEWEDYDRCADLLFIDMDEIDGMQTAVKLREQHIDTLIVFLTSNREKVFDVFDVGAINCILTDEMVWEKQCLIIEKAIYRAEEYANQNIVFKNRRGECKVLLKDIQYFEVFNHQITMNYQRRNEDPEQFMFSGSMGKLGKALQKKGFIHPNRAFVVSMNYIKAAVKGKIVLMNDIEINIGRNKLKEVKEELNI